MQKRKILWLENDILFAQPYVEVLSDKQYDVILVQTSSEALRVLSSDENISFAIIDIVIPPSEDQDIVKTRGGFRAGIEIGRWIKANRPDLPFIAFSVGQEPEVVSWFIENALGYIPKYKLRDIHDFAAYVEKVIKGNMIKQNPRIFIVHGHDENSKLQLKNYIQNTLKLGEPIILHEQPSQGRTIIEKFENYAKDIDLVFVLLTPDDTMNNELSSDSQKRRSRQNVIFEMGYFFAQLQRSTGRVLLLYKGNIELPSDISGLIYINIDNGIESAGELIRRELTSFI